jgi:hypothetical protein
MGYSEDGNLSNYSSMEATTVSGTDYVGGIVGYLKDGSVSSTVNHAAVIASSTYVGGICGYVSGNDVYTIENCSNYGNLTNGNVIGGLVGFSNISIKSCNNSGNILVQNGYSGLNTGGLVGILDGGSNAGVSLYCSFNTGNVTNNAYEVENSEKEKEVFHVSARSVWLERY